MKITNISQNRILLISASLLLVLVSCKKFVEVAPPITQLVTTDVFNNSSSATSAQIVIYSKMANNSESYLMAQYTGLMDDELANHSNNQFFKLAYINALSSTSTPGPWTRAYNYIFQANAVISGLENNKTINNSIRQQLIGEAKFVRAFWHFYLTNLYGDIPLVTSIDYTINSIANRTPKSKVYQQIINDLKDSESLLNSNFVDASDTSITVERVRPTKWAAAALLSRVYLYTGDYTNAEAKSTEVINKTDLFSLCPDLNNVFLANSTEAIWQLATPLPTSYNTADGNSFILRSAPSTNTNNSSTISPQLLASFEQGDKRKTNWIGTFTPDSINFYYFPYKYKVYQSSTVTEYVMVLRLAEQYLIRAESRANLNNLSAAASDLNIIRSRAGLAGSSAVTQTDLLAAIFHERQNEFFTEWGHRWLDLIRTGNANAVMSLVTPQKGGVWSSDNHQLLFPIPQSEINLDHNLTQNPGY